MKKGKEVYGNQNEINFLLRGNHRHQSINNAIMVQLCPFSLIISLLTSSGDKIYTKKKGLKNSNLLFTTTTTTVSLLHFLVGSSPFIVQASPAEWKRGRKVESKKMPRLFIGMTPGDTCPPLVSEKRQAN